MTTADAVVAGVLAVPVAVYTAWFWRWLGWQRRYQRVVAEHVARMPEDLAWRLYRQEAFEAAVRVRARRFAVQAAAEIEARRSSRVPRLALVERGERP